VGKNKVSVVSEPTLASLTTPTIPCAERSVSSGITGAFARD